MIIPLVRNGSSEVLPAVRNRYEAFDILRVLAICYIIMIRHIDDYASEMFLCQLVKDLTYVSLGVLVYISGYLLAINNMSFSSTTDVKDFFIKRVLRIYPLYALALFIFYLLSIINFHQLYSGLLLINLFNAEHILTLWYVSMIMIFYISFMVLNYEYNSLKFLFISAFVFFILIFEKITIKVIDNSLLLYFPSFICGILVAKYYNCLKLNNIKSIFILLIFFMVLYLKDLAPSKLSIMFIYILILSFSVPAMFLLSKLKINITVSKIVINVSYASFCMYLAHRIIFKIALLIYKPETDINTLAYLYLIAMPIIYIVCFHVQKFYDKFLETITLVSKQRSLS